jgi:membrane protease YdiL (CAAX protease family)
VENRNSGNHDLFYGKDGDLTGSDKESPEVSMLALRGAGREALLGGAIGLGFVLVSALMIAVFGGCSFSWAGHGFMAVVWSAVMVQIGTAVTEELLFRGLALQALEQLWGSRAAIVITGMFFGTAHLGTPGASAWSALAIASEAGVMLGAAFLWRRSIWFVAGLHFVWNTTEQLLGIPVSGHTSEGRFTVDVHGPLRCLGAVRCSGRRSTGGRSRTPSSRTASSPWCWPCWPSCLPCPTSEGGSGISLSGRRAR